MITIRHNSFFIWESSRSMFTSRYFVIPHGSTLWSINHRHTEMSFAVLVPPRKLWKFLCQACIVTWSQDSAHHQTRQYRDNFKSYVIYTIPSPRILICDGYINWCIIIHFQVMIFSEILFPSDSKGIYSTWFLGWEFDWLVKLSLS